MNKWEGSVANSYLRRKKTWLHGAQTLSVAAILGWMAFTLLFLGTSDPPTPEKSPWWVAVGGHLFLFSVLGVLTTGCVAAIARSPGPTRYLIAVALIGILWGAFTELYQLTVPGRSASFADLGLDVGGSLFGGIAVWTAGTWIMRRFLNARSA